MVFGLGGLRWSFQAEQAIHGTPAFTDGAVYIGAHDSHVYAIDADGGKVRWSYATDEAVQAQPQVVDGNVYIATLAGTVLALQPQ